MEAVRLSRRRGHRFGLLSTHFSVRPNGGFRFDLSHEVVLINGTPVAVRWRMSDCATAECCL